MLCRMVHVVYVHSAIPVEYHSPHLEGEREGGGRKGGREGVCIIINAVSELRFSIMSRVC